MADIVNIRLGTFGKDDHSSVALVALGGVLGGLLQPVVATMHLSQVNPTSGSVCRQCRSTA